MKTTFLVLIAFVAMNSLNAQNSTSNSLEYKSAAGVRFWDGGGLSLKTFFKPKNAAEVIGFFFKGGTRLTGLYEYHTELNTEGNLKWFVGAGGGVTFVSSKTGLHVSGIVGLDYKFNNLPINLSLDWIPSVETGLGAGTYFNGRIFGVTGRYTF